MNKLHLNQFIKVLTAMDGILEKTAAHADQRKFDVNVFLSAKVAPDMWPLHKQIQSACGWAQEAAATLAKTPAAKLEEAKTWSELRANVKNTAEFLKSLKDPDYTNIKEVKFSPVWAGGQWLDGEEAFYELSLPNFYFHATTAYNILRSTGVAIGKGDFLGQLNFKK